METFRFHEGRLPLLVSMPHVGTGIPEEIAPRLTPGARQVPDADWHVDRLYDFLGELGASRIQAIFARYVVDLNRPPDDRPLYPGAGNTGLCPTVSFDDLPLYLPGEEPDAAEVARRRAAFWQPYHEKIAAELARLKDRHGIALLWDAHSIRSRVPRFFEGRLPDLNLGSAEGRSAAPELIAAVAAAAKDSPYSSVLDGRFKGGYITRAYGAPQRGVHALQLELSQITYMQEEPPYSFREDLAAQVRPTLVRLIETALAWAETPQTAPRGLPP